MTEQEMELLEKGKEKGQREKEEDDAFAFCLNNKCSALVIRNMWS